MLTKGRPCHPGPIGVRARDQLRARQRRQAADGSEHAALQAGVLGDVSSTWTCNGNLEDPESKCQPPGLPRMGPPSKIVQTPNELIFLYQTHNTFRVIPIDGRPHDPIRSQDTTWYGDSRRHAGKATRSSSTVVGFTDESWLGWPGWFHSNNMRVIERFAATGNTLPWQATVEDPDVLIEPWTMNPRTLKLNPNPKALLIEDLPCEERDLEHMTSLERG